MAVSAIVAAASTASGLAASGGVAASLTFSFGLAGFAGIASHFLVTTALGAALNALTPKPSAGGGIGGYSGNAIGSNLDRQVIYGETRVGSVVVFADTFGPSNWYLDQVHVFAGHPIEEFVEWYIDGNRVVDLDPTTGEVLEVELEDGTFSTTLYAPNRAYIKNPRLGTETTPAFPDLIQRYTDDGITDQWTNACRLTGCAAVHTQFIVNTETNIWPNGLPKVEAIIKGKKVYDPRTGVTAWSDNAALCIADFLVSDYGVAEDDNLIDWGSVSAAAAVCDQTNTPQGEKRYAFDGAFLTSTTPYDFLSQGLTAMGGSLWYSQGNWRMKAAHWTAPVLTITEDDLRTGQIDLNTRHSRRDNFNEIKGTYRGPETKYQVTNYPAVRNYTATGPLVIVGNMQVGESYEIASLGVTTDWNFIAGTTGKTYNVGDVVRVVNVQATDGDGYITYDAFLDVDNGQRSSIALDLPFVSNSDQCKRLARIALERNREQLTVAVTTNLRSMKAQVGDNIEFTYERFGWDRKTFEVVSWGFVITDELEPLIKMVLREVSQAVFDDKYDGIALERNNTRLPNPFTLSAPISLAYNHESNIDDDGKTVTSILFDWTHEEPDSVTNYEFQYKVNGTSEWFGGSSVVNSNFTLPNVPSNVVYNWRVRAVNALGIKSAWAVGTNAAGLPDATVPQAPQSVTGAGSYRSIKLDWPNVTLNTDGSAYKDHNYYEIFRDSVLVGTSNGSSFVDNALSSATNYAYTVRATDLTGNVSALSSVTNIVTLADPADGVDGISVLIVYAEDASGNNQSTTAGSREFVQYVEYNTGGSTPSLPVSGTFVKFVGSGQSIWPIYASDASGSEQSFIQDNGGINRPFVNFYERANAAPTLPRFQDENGNTLYWARVGAEAGVPGEDAVNIYISADDQTVTYDGNGNISPSSQTFNFEAFTSNTGTNTVSWTTVPNVKSGTGTNFYLDETHFDSKFSGAQKVQVTASVNSDAGVISDTVTVYPLKDGSGGINVLLTNEAVSVPANDDGSAPFLGLTETSIVVYQGIDTLEATLVDPPPEGAFTVIAVSYPGASGPQTGTVNGAVYTLGDLTAMTSDAAERVIFIRYRANGQSSAIATRVTQSFAKAKQGNSGQTGDRGPGRWDIILPSGVPLPKNSSNGYAYYWNTYGRINGNVAPVRPVRNDQAWYRDSNKNQDVAICQTVTSDTVHTWQQQDEVVDGNLLVTGTLNVMDVAIGGNIQSNNFVSGSTGWRIRSTGSAEFNGPVISRPVELHSFDRTLSGNFFPGNRLSWFNTGVRLGVNDLANATNNTVLIQVALVGLPSSTGTFPSSETYWGFDCELINGARRQLNGNTWNQSSFSYRNDPSSVVTFPGATATNQRLLFDLVFYGTPGVGFSNPTVRVTTYLVS